MGKLTYFVLCSLVLLHFVNCKKLQGVLETKTSRWEFLTRFCFLNKLGGLQYEIKYPKAYGVQRLLFYYDTPGQWNFVYKRGKTCEEKTTVAIAGSNYFTLDASRCDTLIRKDGTQWFTCRANLDFHSARERWWYLVVERCGDATDPSKKGLYLEYDLHLTNGDNLLHKEFSADEFYILPINIVFFIMYVIMLILSICVAVILKKKTLYHTTYAMYLCAIVIWTVALLIQVIAWGSYGSTGWEQKRMEVLGRILQGVSNIIFMLMLILMAKGYTIVRGKLTNKATLKITIFIVMYIIMSIVLLVWEANIFDPGKVLFYYENPAGYCMVAIQLVGWLWMTKASVFTLKHFSNTTAKFYIPFYIFFTVWFWMAPGTIMLAIMAMPKWMREKTVHGVLQFVAFCGHAIFLILTRPSEANSNFPYNIKTSQIDIIGEEEEEQQNYYNTDPTNSYAVSYSNQFHGTGPNLDIFITSKHDSNHANYSNGQAGYPETSTHDRMYSPLDRFVHSSLAARAEPSTSDSPPPSYPQAMSDSPDTQEDESHGFTLPVSSDVSNDNEALASPLPPASTLLPLHNNNNILPPLGETTHLPSSSSARETTLPPIRGSRLPALEPSAPPLDRNANGAPPDYFNVFQAK